MDDTLRLVARMVLPDMVEKRIKFALMEEAVHVDSVSRELPVRVENKTVEVNSVEANKEEVKTENPRIEETVI